MTSNQPNIIIIKTDDQNYSLINVANEIFTFIYHFVIIKNRIIII